MRMVLRIGAQVGVGRGGRNSGSGRSGKFLETVTIVGIGVVVTPARPGASPIWRGRATAGGHRRAGARALKCVGKHRKDGRDLHDKAESCAQEGRKA